MTSNNEITNDLRSRLERYGMREVARLEKLRDNVAFGFDRTVDVTSVLAAIDAQIQQVRADIATLNDIYVGQFGAEARRQWRNEDHEPQDPHDAQLMHAWECEGGLCGA